MKVIAYSFLLVIFLTGCDRVKSTKKESPLSVHAEILLAGDYMSPFDTLELTKTSVLRIYVRNQTRKTVSFWMMNCSWHDSFIFDSDNTDFYRTSCTRNFPIEFTLSPNDSIIFTSLVQQKKLAERSIPFRVGFINFSERDLMDLFKKYDKSYRSNKDIYWSNSVTPINNRPSYGINQ